jgi:hypothetical protein
MIPLYSVYMPFALKDLYTMVATPRLINCFPVDLPIIFNNADNLFQKAYE